MPEGDSIHLSARRLKPVLEGRVAEEFWARHLKMGAERRASGGMGYSPRPGMRIVEVRAVGKHLLIEFETRGRNIIVDVHLEMTGRWQIARAGQKPPVWRNRPGASLAIVTDKGTAVCWRAPSVSVSLASDAVADGAQANERHLGPDLTVPSPDLEEITKRASVRAQTENPAIHELLLDQTVASGIGNVYKSEVLFVERVNPFALAAKLGSDRILTLYETASKLLFQNAYEKARPGPRETTPSGGLYVYGRWRKPCRVCDYTIERSYKGKHSRSTYWCPKCQPR